MKRPCPVSRRRSSSLPFMSEWRIPEPPGFTAGKARASVLKRGRDRASLPQPHRRLARARGHRAERVLAAAREREAERPGAALRGLQRDRPEALGRKPLRQRRPAFALRPLPLQRRARPRDLGRGACPPLPDPRLHAGPGAFLRAAASGRARPLRASARPALPLLIPAAPKPPPAAVRLF